MREFSFPFSPAEFSIEQISEAFESKMNSVKFILRVIFSIRVSSLFSLSLFLDELKTP